MGLTQWDKFVVERVAVPIISVSEQRPLVHLVDSILSAKADNSLADTHRLESEIDRIVYGLYQLSTNEIALLETTKRNASANKR